MTPSSNHEPAVVDAVKQAKEAMMKSNKRLTDTLAGSLPTPAAGYALYWCPKTPGFGLRVTEAGVRAWVGERRMDDRRHPGKEKTVRRTLGTACGTGRESLTAEAARAEWVTISAELQQGKDRREVKREAAKAEAVEAVTFETALRAYVKTKHRPDGRALTPRTISDYLSMIEPPHMKANGEKTKGGALHTLASTSLARLTAKDIHTVYDDLAPRGERRQTYAMQVLRAVLRREGVKIEGNPLSPTTTAGKDCVHLAPPRGDPKPIPAERLGGWYHAACAHAGRGVSVDQLRFMLLTGCRPGEAEKLLVRNVDLDAGKAILIDTKNRKDHTLVLSTQAAAIVAEHVAGKKAGDPVFGVEDTSKVIAQINEAAGTPGVTPHKLRHTFASIADDLVSAATARAMLNHAGGDVTQKHYIGKSDDQLRAGWQAVADFIVAEAVKVPTEAAARARKPA